MEDTKINIEWSTFDELLGKYNREEDVEVLKDGVRRIREGLYTVLEQNPNKDSVYAGVAKKGHKLIWLIHGSNGNSKFLGFELDAVKFKFCKDLPPYDNEKEISEGFFLLTKGKKSTPVGVKIISKNVTYYAKALDVKEDQEGDNREKVREIITEIRKLLESLENLL